MNKDDLSREIASFLNTGNRDEIIINLPEGSGICHIANVDAPNWISGFVGPTPGRWKKAGEEKKHFADSFITSANELYGYDHESLKEKVFEKWRIKAPIPAINIEAFPTHIQEAFYEDKGSAPFKWSKSYVLLDQVNLAPNYSGIRTIFAPTASGIEMGIEGNVIVGDSNTIPIEMEGTGSYDDFFGK